MRRTLGTLALLVLFLTACGRRVPAAPATPSQPPAGRPAPDLMPALSQLNGVRLPVYLPGRLPASGAPAPYQTSVSATATTYAVSASRTGASIVIAGGPSVSFGDGLPRWTALPQSTKLPDGTAVYFYPGQGIEWIQNRWQFAVVDDAASPTTPDALLPQIDRLRHALPSFGNPIARGTEGTVVEHLGSDPPDIDVLWMNGPYAYEVLAHGVSGIDVARALVMVQ